MEKCSAENINNFSNTNNIEDNLPKVVCVVGPTASGKTEYAINIAKERNGEIVSCDSMQIYKYMDIGTAKATADERAQVPHHMIDFVDPGYNYSVADFVKDARLCIDDILSRGKLPVLCGGTGLYLDSVLKSVEFSPEKRDDKLRNSLWKLYETDGAEAVHKILADLDPIEAEKVHCNNVKRVIRGIEICKTTGMTKTEADKLAIGKPMYDSEIYGLNMEREKLYERINLRVDMMVKEGLVDEVRSLLDMGIPEDSTAMQAIGYKELVGYIKGERNLDDAIEDIKRESRRYAKRQLTWFKRNKDIIWINR